MNHMPLWLPPLEAPKVAPLPQGQGWAGFGEGHKQNDCNKALLLHQKQKMHFLANLMCICMT
jgi:hypothetical protein